jgi:hypothetical protein
LKKSLPGNLSKNAKREALGARIKKIQNLKPKKPGRSMAMRGQAGTQNALLKIKRISQMQSKHP